MTPAVATLERAIRTVQPAGEDIRRRQQQVAEDVLARSPYLRAPNFAVIHDEDLERLFHAYDERFFGRLCGAALVGRQLFFRLSRRMTKAGGKTTRIVRSNGGEIYEIAIAVDILFDCFKEGDRSITVCGLPCTSRLEGMQRIFEHEMVHLTELLCWGDSNCSAVRFQDIAARLFLHRAHTHSLITRRERAAQSSIGVGSEVTFEFEGRRHTGRVNRITKRATVLVPDPSGVRYSDGLRYRTFYVPLRALERKG